MGNKETDKINKLIRAHTNYDKELEEIINTRVRIGKDDAVHKQTKTRITLAQTRHPLWKELKNAIIKADLPPLRFNKKGTVQNTLAIIAGLVIFIIVAFVAVTIFAVWNYGFNEVTDSLVNLPNQNSVQNISTYAGITFGNLNASFQQLEFISVGLIIAMILGIFLGAFIVKSHPAWYALYILYAVVIITASILISRSYETLYASGGVLGSTLQDFGGASWLLINLPIITTVVAFIGAILLYVQMNRDPNMGDVI